MNKLEVIELKCNQLLTPLGIDSTPKLSWKINSDLSGDCQKKYRICVSTSISNINCENYNVWDSGFIDSEDTFQHKLINTDFKARTRYYWLVKIINSCGDEKSSAVTWFEIGMMGEQFISKWISKKYDKTIESSEKAPYLRKEFTLRSNVLSARLYISGLGYFHAYINGQRVGDDHLSTPYTRYDARVLYRTFDIQNLIKDNKNAIGIIVGNGWYNCNVEDPWNTMQSTWKHFAKAIAEIHIEYLDGSKEVITTDNSWKSSEGPIQKNNIRNGTFYDARLEMKGWNDIGFDDNNWENAQLMRAPGGALLAAEIEPIRITKEISAIKKWKDDSGNWCFDLGQNIAGICRFKVSGKIGDEITFKYTDVLLEDKVNLDFTRNAGFVRSGEFQTDKYIKATNEEEIFQPSFMYHGFQYISIIGINYEPKLGNVIGLLMHTDFDKTADFSCDNEMINKIQTLCNWSTVDNFYSVPTDCPHREKNAWTGDASVSCEQTMINYGSFAAYNKWADDLIDAQKENGNLPCVVPSTGWGYNTINGPDWSSAIHLIPWTLYLYSGDISMLEKMFIPMKKHVDYDAQMANDNIVSYGLGDWCAPYEGEALFVNMSKFKCPSKVSDTAFYYLSTIIVAKAAKILGKNIVAQQYFDKAEEIKKSFRDKFYNEEIGIVLGDCQTSTALFFCLGLSNIGEEKILMEKLEMQIKRENGHLDFGILGGKYVPEMLGRMGRTDLMVEMLNKKTYPSFGKWIEDGATTLWECWNTLGSHNHQMFSSISAFFYKYIAGICVDEENVGFKHFYLRPAINSGLNMACAKYNSQSGLITINWKNNIYGHTEIEIEIPTNTSATLEIPGGKTILEGTHVVSENANQILLQSGKYKFKIV